MEEWVNGILDKGARPLVPFKVFLNPFFIPGLIEIMNLNET
jgi:hypothetical protein